MMIRDYVFSPFGNSSLARLSAEKLPVWVGEQMEKLSTSSPYGRKWVRLLSPFIGGSVALCVLLLRILSIAEPIFGLLADPIVSLVFRKNLLSTFLTRFFYIPYNTCTNIVLIPYDLIREGIVIGVGGIFFPQWHQAIKWPFSYKRENLVDQSFPLT